MSSGVPVSDIVAKDLNAFDDLDCEFKLKFQKRLIEGNEGSFFEPIKRMKLKTINEGCVKSTTTASQVKVGIIYIEPIPLRVLVRGNPWSTCSRSRMSSIAHS